MSTLVRCDIPYSVGGFIRPNRWEEEAALFFVESLERNAAQRRPLFVVPGAPQAARRFLHALANMSPARDPDYVVATGDYIDFNTIYRDRNILWPIQDLPFRLVAFCQRNPVDPNAFRPDDPTETSRPDPGGKTSTGTHDLLLYRDIVETVLHAAYPSDTQSGKDQLEKKINAEDFRLALANARLDSGARRFDEAGNLTSGAGEYVVCLRPVRKHGRVMPNARLQVWKRSADATHKLRWEPVLIEGKPELDVAYFQGWNAEKQ